MLASLSDVEARLKDPDGEFDEQRALGLLEEASALVMSYLGVVSDPVPDVVRIVVSRMVARVLEAPVASHGAETVSYTAGPFAANMSFSQGSSGGAPWLTVSDKTMLGPFVRRRRGGVFSMTLG